VSAVERFLAAASRRDADAMAAEMAADVRLYTPVRSRPVEGRERVRLVFGGFTQVLTDVEYKRVLSDDTGHNGSATLASRAIFFSATVGEEEIDGVILLEVDTGEEIRAATVFVRPLPGLQAFAAAMKDRLAPAGRSAD
jgi:limonene-1,2-epoxide hydrolase